MPRRWLESSRDESLHQVELTADIYNDFLTQYCLISRIPTFLFYYYHFILFAFNFDINGCIKYKHLLMIERLIKQKPKKKIAVISKTCNFNVYTVKMHQSKSCNFNNYFALYTIL